MCPSSSKAEKEKALKADVSELSEQDQDLDDQLMIDEESLQAKSDDISALLQKNEDITVRPCWLVKSIVALLHYCADHV